MLAAISSLALAASGLFPADLHGILNRLDLPPQTQQVLLVSSDGWEKSAGQMRRFVRQVDGWRSAGADTTVLLGVKGMGWGCGLHRRVAAGPQKVEGDRRTPAGIFSMGSAFGYAATPPPGTRWPWQTCTVGDFFVDDVRSPEYNQWVRLAGTTNPAERWASFERMRRTDGRHEFGVVVNHNTSPVVAGKGSAIFLHVWNAPSQATVGCTVMPREHMAALVRWLDPSKRPLLIQAPKNQFGSLRLK